MHNSYGSPALTDCTFTNNWANYEGGGMYNSYGSPALTDCTFTNNWANYEGGGMNNSNGSSPTLTDTTVCNNTPDQVNGPWTDNAGNCVQESCDDCVEDCPADFNDDGEVSGGDLGLLLAMWGTADGDLNGDGTTSGADLGLLLSAWGPCP
jgi:hypothetical protein